VNREASLIIEESPGTQAAQDAPALFVEVRRGAITESRHRGHLSVVDGRGRVLLSKGAPETVTFPRSSAKPHQVIPLIATGAVEHFHFTDREIAVACGSHNGEAEHREAVASMLGKIGLDESALNCGTHEPYGEEAAEELKRRGAKPSPIHNNCSGKHAMMLALALYLKAPVEDYERFEHPVQQMIARTVAQFSDVPVEEMGIAIDGCSAPNFATPLRSMALMYARLIRPPEWLDAATREACGRVVRAMTVYPEMVEGRNELDTSLMKACGGRLVSKVGAEGVYTAGVLPCELYPDGLGLAFKIEDGDKGDRARSTLAVEVLRQLGVLKDADVSGLEKFARHVIRNHRGDEVGESVAVLDLKN
jgi:L-asparaginase II